jgi:hypothetical protein
MRGVFFMILLAGCSRSASGDSLVVVTVDAAQPLAGVSLHAVATAGGMTSEIDIAGPLTIPPSTNFGVKLRRSISGELAIHVEARDAGGATLASGDGTVTLSPGKRVDLALQLSAAMPDLLPASDGAPLSPDMAAPPDLAAAPDLLAPPIIDTSRPFWIGAGGAASERLNLSMGGFDTAGEVAAPSGARLNGGYFSSQTH